MGIIAYAVIVFHVLFMGIMCLSIVLAEVVFKGTASSRQGKARDANKPFPIARLPWPPSSFRLP